MPEYRVIINTDNLPDHEAGLQKVVSDYNDSIAIPPEPDPQNPIPPEQGTPLTAEQYLQRALEIVVQSYADQFVAEKAAAVFVKFSKADAAVRTTVEDALASVPVGSFQPQPLETLK